MSEVPKIFLMPWEEGRKPDYVNGLGIEWYIDHISSEYATGSGNGQVLKDHIVYVVKMPDGEVNRLIVNAGQIIFETKSLEAIGEEIDQLKLLQKFNKKHDVI